MKWDVVPAWCEFLKINEWKAPGVYLDCAASSRACEEDKAVVGEGEGIDGRTALAVFVKTAM
jgi:hypothetical protein